MQIVLQQYPEMKKFEIKKSPPDNWIVSHNEVPKFTCHFQDKKFNYNRKIIGLTDPTGNPKEILLLQRMEKWLVQFHKDKING
jgi:hypothetical protein